MSYTKEQLALSALEEIGIASYEFDIDPEQISSAIGRLDAMLATWSARGVTFSYPIQKEQDSISTTDSSIPDWAWEAVITNLAVKLGPSYGKAVSTETKIAAKNALETVYGIFSKPKEMQLGTMPLGAGYKSTDTRFTKAPVELYISPVDEEFDPSGGIA